ncbi:MAG: sulfatase-like hydrolase/transferase [Deltaproteobacteria bacterium]|nr:sulfatase-like hydrolase/transferase [Deltaproteobacteria bacterium]MBW2445353.1 sulfatase-like hydrolase/transferase [Deltaproteobacteria bacterium]
MVAPPLSRREFVRRSALAAAASAVPFGCGRAPEHKPNLLVLCSDQQHWQAMGFVDEFFDTPNADALALESTVFERAFCASPQCSPSRSAMLTGFYPHHTRVMNNEGAVGGPALAMETIGPALQRGGYHTGYFGKWHLGNEPLGNSGWDERNTAGVDPATTGRALDFLHRHAQSEKPFALFLMYVDPHDVYAFSPDVPPGATATGAPLGESWRRERFEGKPAPQEQFMTGDQGRVIWGRAQPVWEAYREFYRGKVELYDRHLGSVVRILKALGLWESTVVLNTSDHGEMDTQHKLVFKGPFMYEHVVRIPMTVRVPEAFAGVGPQRVADYDWVNVDTVPTLLDLAGLDPPECHGRSARAILTGQGARPSRDYVVGQYFGKQGWLNPIRMIRTPDWKLNVYIGHGEELYDLRNDPHELVNLAADAGRAGRMRELRAELDAWIRDHADPFDRLEATPLG